MMTTDSSVDREAGPVRYLSGPVRLNQAHLEFDSVTGLMRTFLGLFHASKTVF